MFTFLLESVCFDSINRIQIGLMKKKNERRTTKMNRGKNVICLNGKFLTIPTVRKALNSFCSKTRNISEIIVCDNLHGHRAQLTVKSLVKILLENGKKNNWKLTHLHLHIKQVFPEIEQLIDFSNRSLLKLNLLTSYQSTISNETIQQCLKLQQLTFGFRITFTNVDTFLQSSELPLKILRISVPINRIVAILKRLRTTLKVLIFDPTRLYYYSISGFLDAFEDNEEPFEPLLGLYFRQLIPVDPYFIMKDTDVVKLFRLFPNLQKLKTLTRFSLGCFQFARIYLDLFRNHAIVRHFMFIVNYFRVDPQSERFHITMRNHFPSGQYTWYIDCRYNNCQELVVIQQGNASISFLST